MELRRRTSAIRQAFSVGLVAVLAGWLFTWNAGSGSSSDLRDAPGLRGMVTARDREVEQLQARQAELAAVVGALVGMAAPPGVELTGSTTTAPVGSSGVKGPGLTVTLDDADQDILAEPVVSGAELLVHQQDIDAVINALWAGGAEAVAVQGHRLGSTTAVKCVGNVILVGGRVHSPPYQIAAVGPADQMRQRLDTAPAIRAFRERANRLGLTWSTMDESELTMPGDTAAASALRYARTVVPPPASKDRTRP
ncbi:MAG: DUF881 domain-containing protein [Bifidobacteriaceae bacterium]|jgi:uncharacterized protein YlxW (UPF0749 family)|nr:DUF881 domain-containing protein [Bifidobacteriaceae bacterium]